MGEFKIFDDPQQLAVTALIAAGVIGWGTIEGLIWVVGKLTA